MLMLQAGLVIENAVSKVENSSAINESGPGILDAWHIGLVAAHDDLDAAINALLFLHHGDDLLIQRLKKRKLHLKDMIAGLLPPIPMPGAAL